MKAFLKSIDEGVWLSIENGWERPTTAIGESTTAQKEAASFNSKAMNAIFNFVSIEEFIGSQMLILLTLLRTSYKQCMKALRQ